MIKILLSPLLACIVFSSYGQLVTNTFYPDEKLAGYSSISKGIGIDENLTHINSFSSGFNPPGSRMKKVGGTLMIIGGGFLIGGIITYASADKTYTTGPSSTGSTVYYYKDQNVIIGMLMIVGGVGATIPGIIFYTIGNKKVKHYKKEQELSLRLNGAGLALKLKI